MGGESGRENSHECVEKKGEAAGEGKGVVQVKVVGEVLGG